MPVDPEVVVGTLPNGLRYYVRANGKPGPPGRAAARRQGRVRCWKTTTSRGVAHFVEHMEFEGTQHFPRQSIVDFLSSLGLSIGPDANAATSYDDTQYTLRVPTDVPGVLDRALLVLEDWAQGASFDQSGIDHERGIVLSEWRMHLGAGERTEDKIRRVQLEGSRYADRPPIGNPDIIEHAQREQLTRFYRDWYRPDLMAVIVVGDVDRDAVAAMIKEHFSSLAAPSPERPRPAFDVPEHARHALRRRHRQGNDRDRRPDQRPPAGAQPGVGRRLSRPDARPVVRRHARRPARRAQPERESAVSQGGRGSRAVPGAAGRGTRRCSRRSSRTTAWRAASTRS